MAESWLQASARKNSVAADMGQEQVTLQKIASLEDDYSKMKMSLLSSLESDDELSPEGAERVLAPPDVVRTSRIDSRSFLDDSSPSSKDLSRTHGKASTVAEFVDEQPKLGDNPSAVTHEDVLARRGKGARGNAVFTIPEEEETGVPASKGRQVLHAIPIPRILHGFLRNCCLLEFNFTPSPSDFSSLTTNKAMALKLGAKLEHLLQKPKL